MKLGNKSNVELKNLVVDLCKFSNENKVDLWRRIAEDLTKPTRQRRLVNTFKINLTTKEGETIIVPGKVLGSGDINHKVNVAAFDFSSSAIEKIKNAKGNVMTIKELLEKNPKAKDVRIIG
jgi:large subunit ribosomal protein L18e